MLWPVSFPVFTKCDGMKKILLFIVVASLSMLGAGAREGRHDTDESRQSVSLTRDIPPAITQEMKRNTLLGSIQFLPLKILSEDRPYYLRPAGAYYAPYVAVNGSGFYYYGDFSYILVKPYSKYTYRTEAVNNYYFYWLSDELDENFVDKSLEHTVSYDIMEQVPPKLCFTHERDENETVYCFQYPGYYGSLEWGGDNPFIDEDGSHLMVVPAVNSAMVVDENTEFLLSSKTMVEDGASLVNLARYTGAEPYGTNKYGWWFGKNSEHIDGMAQAFEKPTHPYLLNKVFLQTGLDLRVKEDVLMTCRVYKLDAIPSFLPGGCVELPEVPGELVVFGEALVTPRTTENKNGLIEFTLFSCDEDDPSLTFEYTPTIDYPILICIDGYNDPEMENLEEFSAFISSNYYSDEGYGELAYLKCPVYEVELDENGDTIRDSRERPVTSFKGKYYWSGLNNFFSDVPVMKTGLTIFIAADRPYLAFNHSFDDIGVYEFDENGGEMVRQMDGETFKGIEFNAWTPSCDDDWTVSRKGDEELPEWLGIELIDGVDENGEFNNIVTANISADPMPANLAYREAVIRFEFPGAYLDYRFRQGGKVYPPNPCDPDGNGEMTIAVVNRLIDLLLDDMYDDCYDYNYDGELSVADVNMLIEIILTY